VAPAEIARAHLFIVGHVQGVGFRYAVEHEASARGLGGWVRNLDSGAVEAIVEGSRADVVDVVEWCREGPPGAYVRTLSVEWAEPPQGLRTFEIRPTGFGFTRPPPTRD
jgi:acylphosphatase